MFFITLQNNLLAQVNAGEDQEICVDTAIMHATNPFPQTGYWELISGAATIENSTLYNTKVINIAQGENIFRWVVGAFSDTVVITNNSFEVDAGDFQWVMLPNAYLNATEIPNTIGTWSVAYGSGEFENSNSGSSFVNNINFWNNDFVWTIYNPQTGCSNSDTVVIFFYSIDEGPSLPIYLCSDTTTIEAYEIPDFTTFWSVHFGFCRFEDSTSVKTHIYDISIGLNIVAWNISKNGYLVKDTTYIYNYNFELDAGTDTIINENNFILSGSEPLNTPFNMNWLGEWSLIDGFGDIQEPSNLITNVTDLNEGENIFEWFVQFSFSDFYCYHSDTVSITFNPLYFEDNSQKFFVFPNPSSGLFTIKSPIFENDVTIEIIDSKGLKINYKTSEHQVNTLNFDLSGNPSGVYFIKIQSEKEVIIKKVVLE